jgi:tyrosinase
MVHSSHFMLVLLWAVSLFHVPVLAEYGETNHKCKDLLQRREWCSLSSTCPHFDLLTVCARRKLNNTEKADYIKAVQCLQARPPLHENIAAVKTRFDEFQALHIDVADGVHTTVNLRYFLH